MIYEIRTYRVKVGSLPEVEKRFGEAYEHRKKISPLAAFWHTEIGPLNEIIHVWPYENLGERSRLSYWVNRIFYPVPVNASCKMPDATQDPAAVSPGAMSIRAIADPAAGVEPLLPEEATRKQERAVLERIANRTLAAAPSTGSIDAADYHTRVLPLPKPLREFISRRITKAFLKDVHEFLFVPERREIMRESVLSRLRTGGGPFIVIAHSQGSMIAYDALSSLKPGDGIEIDLFVTIGSPHRLGPPSRR